MKNRHHEKGIALIFALGLLALLMVVGMAFVANSLIASKVAQNNSARTQSRMLANTAMNRALASIMVFQQQHLYGNTGRLLTSFEHIRSHSNSSDANANDQLTGNDSVMNLPLNDAVVSKNVAKRFNEKTRNWNGKWVYFYNDYDTTNTTTRRVIGRAAWQVVSEAPQISAPVFMSGMLPPYGEHFSSGSPKDSSVNWFPREHRWGRDIDEAFLDASGTPQFAGVASYFKDGLYDSYENFYDKEPNVIPGTDITTDLQKRWFERWFDIDADRTDFEVNPPTAKFEECYIAMNGARAIKKNRFNISEINYPLWLSEDELNEDPKISPNWYTRYGVSSTNDQWYARFKVMVDPASGTTVTGVNDETSLNNLTRNSTNFVEADPKHMYDFDYNTVTGLPFLRRIGNDKATFATIDLLRKQIAANFNDYCDADSIPTSNVPANTWADTTLATQPTWTGNERTPYIYELGFRGALALDNDGDGNAATATLKLTGTVDSAANTVTVSMPTTLEKAISISPIMKLANIYPQTYASADCKALVALEKAKVSFAAQEVDLKVTYSIEHTEGSATSTVERTLTKTLQDLQTTDKTTAAAALQALYEKFQTTTFTGTVDPSDKSTLISTLNFAGLKTDGTAPYPVAKEETTPIQTHNFTAISGSCTITVNADLIKAFNDAANGIQTGDNETTFALKSAELTIKKSAITALEVNVDRMALYTEDTSGGAAVKKGLDFVRKFETPLRWDVTREANGHLLADKTPFSIATGSTTNGYFLGGIMNFDPRQNLNNADWFPFTGGVKTSITEAGGAAYDVHKVLAVPATDYANTFTDLNKVMAVTDAAVGNANTKVAEIPADTAFADTDFQPTGKTATVGDAEIATEPGYNTSSAATDKYISTAVIRNAPMMSPWEIGFIHRGARWQTLNIKSAAAPDGSDTSKIALTDYIDNADWAAATGTSYAGGDAALLDQIKMTDRCYTYGKVNMERLVAGRENFDEELDKNITGALFNGVKYNENPSDFIHNSTRSTADSKLPVNNLQLSGTAIGNFNTSGFANLTARTETYESRAQFINTGNSSTYYGNAFGAATTNANDAAQEEIIGKTVNLISAGASSPTNIKVLVVAQSINDLAGYQYRTNSEGDEVTATTTPALGTFDMQTTTVNGNTENIYFDEITGEVKMFVTVDRNPTTGQLRIRKIDYIE